MLEEHVALCELKTYEESDRMTAIE